MVWNERTAWEPIRFFADISPFIPSSQIWKRLKIISIENKRKYIKQKWEPFLIKKCSKFNSSKKWGGVNNNKIIHQISDFFKFMKQLSLSFIYSRLFPPEFMDKEQPLSLLVSSTVNPPHPQDGPLVNK